MLGQFVLVATPHKADPTDSSKQKMDFALYHKGSAPEKTGRANWAKVELSLEVKPTDVPDDPFEDISPHYPIVT